MIVLRPYFETGQEGGGGTPPPTPTAAEVEQKEFDSLSVKDPATFTAEEKVKFDTLKSKYDVVEKDAEGNILTPEKKAELVILQTKLDAIAAKDPTTWTKEEKELFEKYEDKEELKPQDVYKKVDELVGFEYEIDYGTVKPESPEGIVLRENTIREVAVTEYVEKLQEELPRAYEFLVHLANGGKEDDFFKIENKDFLNVSIDKNDKGAQESILRTALKIKGNSPEQIEAVVTSFKDNGKLLEQASKELEALQNNQKAVKAKEDSDRKAAEKAQRDAMVGLSTELQTSITKGFDGIVVPPADQASFTKFMAERIFYDKGNFIIRKPLNQKELAKELKVAYFDFKGGDLKSLAERTANTKNVAKFKSLINREVVPKGSAPARGNGKTLGEI